MQAAPGINTPRLQQFARCRADDERGEGEGSAHAQHTHALLQMLLMHDDASQGRSLVRVASGFMQSFNSHTQTQMT